MIEWFREHLIESVGAALVVSLGALALSGQADRVGWVATNAKVIVSEIWPGD